MSDGPPLAQEAPPAVVRGEDPGAMLGAETLGHLQYMAATILAGSIALARADLDAEDAAKLAARMAVVVVNELREYRIVNNKAVRVAAEGADGEGS